MKLAVGGMLNTNKKGRLSVSLEILNSGKIVKLPPMGHLELPPHFHRFSQSSSSLGVGVILRHLLQVLVADVSYRCPAWSEGTDGLFSQLKYIMLSIHQAIVLKSDGSLMQVESIAECSLGAFCNTFDLH